MVRLSDGGSGGTKSVVRKPVALPRNPVPAPKKDSAWVQSKKIQGAAEVTRKTGTTPSYKNAPISKKPLNNYTAKGAGSNGVQPTTVTMKERAAASNQNKNGSTNNSTKTSASYKSSGGGGGGGGGGGSSSGTTSTSATAAATTPKYDQMKDPSYLASVSKLNDLWNQASGYKGQVDDMMKTGFAYDPSTDASYKALSELATKQAKVASGQAMETMNDRGILNSTITGDRLGQIEQTAQDSVIAQVPNLKQQAYGQYMDKLSTLNNLWNSTVAQAQQERSFSEDKRRWELGYQMDQDQFNNSKNQWQQTFDYSKSQDSVKNNLAYGQQALDWRNYDLNYAKNMQAQVGAGNKEATNAAIAELIKGKDKKAIIAQLQSNAQSYLEHGVNISDVLKALNTYYPGLEAEATKSNQNVFNK